MKVDTYIHFSNMIQRLLNVSKYAYLFLVLMLTAGIVNAQKTKTDANIVGHVVSHDEHISYVNIALKGTALGTVTDETGHYRLTNMPEGTFVIVATRIGYKPQEKTITLTSNTTIEVNFALEEDALGLEEVVVSSDRNSKKRGKAPIIVNTISHKQLSLHQSATISDGLSFTTGLRMEANCQNCGFTQLRMNGLEGPYSQILINNRPVYSGLAGVYGLELIPANIIERIEVVRGGGSALYGSNAIAGTVNLILKEPVRNYFQASATTSLAGVGLKQHPKPAGDQNVNFNASVVSDDNKTGFTIYGFVRNRNPFDINLDEFSELTSINNTSAGARFNHRFGSKSKLTIDFLNIRESRRGGNKFDKPPHEADIGEAVDHKLTNGTIEFMRFFREQDVLNAYFSGQLIARDSYYGALQSLSDYGYSNGSTFNTGIQYNAYFDKLSVLIGMENIYDKLKDEKLGYADYDNATIDSGVWIVSHTENILIVDQSFISYGAFGQAEYSLDKFNFTAGMRYENYLIHGNFINVNDNTSEKRGSAISPRLSMLWALAPDLKYRISYAQGYRAPQIYDEDLHILSSGSRKVIHMNSPDLRQETSRSITTSFDYNARIRNTFFEILIEGFYTRLNDPFANQIKTDAINKTVTYLRINAEEGAIVKGLNVETEIAPSLYTNFKAGFTWQSSRYETPQEFDTREFLRTPSTYGYLTFDTRLKKGFELSLTGNYTGSMLVPHYGIDPLTADQAMLEALDKGFIIEGNRLEHSEPFFDLGAKISYAFNINGASLKLLTGVRNIFNSYQREFDMGVYRDPGYIYGPMQPRTVYIGLNIGNRIK